jgi:hypothetical protein
MPLAVFRTPEDEKFWEQAKQIVRERYPEATGPRYYRLVMGIYKRIAHYHPAEHRPMKWPSVSD